MGSTITLTFVIGSITVLNTQIEKVDVEIDVGEDEFLLDQVPDDSGHLVSLHLDDISSLDLANHSLKQYESAKKREREERGKQSARRAAVLCAWHDKRPFGELCGVIVGKEGQWNSDKDRFGTGRWILLPRLLD